MNNSTTLTWTEQQWVSFWKDSTFPTARLTLILFTWHQIVFIGRYIPYWIADHIPLLQQYRIQPDKVLSNKEWWSCVRHVLLSQLLLQTPMMLGFKVVADYLGMEIETVPLPGWKEIFYANIFFLIVEDCYHYFGHRSLHWGPLYKYIHKQHHFYSAPFGIAAEYAHPLETLILGMGFLIGPLIWCQIVGRLHVFTVLVWVAVRLIQTVDAHSGYDFPWALYKFLPFWGGAEFHDYHHQAFVGNYGASFRHWDWLFGTNHAFEIFKAKKRLAHLEGKNKKNL